MPPAAPVRGTHFAAPPRVNSIVCTSVVQKEAFVDVLRVILSILLPPLGVFLQVGIGPHFWINILLTLLGYIPGIVHAIWIIATR